MADGIMKKFNITMSGLLTIDGDTLFINCEDGAQDINLAKLLVDFDGRPVKMSVNYNEEYSEDEASVDAETGEVI